MTEGCLSGADEKEKFNVGQALYNLFLIVTGGIFLVNVAAFYNTGNVKHAFEATWGLIFFAGMLGGRREK